MITRQARIVSRGPDWVQLALAAAPACALCAGRCGLMFNWSQNTAAETVCRLPLAAGSSLAPGDRVSVRLPARNFLQAIAAGFGLPLAGLLAGAWLAEGMFPAVGEALVASAAMAGLATGLAAFRFLVAARLQFSPELRRLPPA